jgi:hypothetical protein
MQEVFNMGPEIVELSYCGHSSPKIFEILHDENGMVHGGEPR